MLCTLCEIGYICINPDSFLFMKSIILMKYSYFTLAILLVLSFNLSAQPEKDIKSDVKKPQTDIIETPKSIMGYAAAEDAEDMYYIVDLNSLEEISSMFSVTDANLCLIDFSFSDKPVTKLTLERAKKIVYEENLEGLPMDAIFEFELNAMGLEKGMYTLKIETEGEDNYSRIVEVM